MAATIQIDVKELKEGFAVCVLSTDQRDVTILMPESDYLKLIKDGFFVRDGTSKDSAGILNTTEVYNL
jgi:hypothetical protein